ncbi:hypothetical protein A2380_02805 [candidate division WWE3 bacterium RIFOXYB1_FULL_43_24]|uniref:Uncharacterized protein n=2 Tax=Katanobacteria TaxID=422282 RepID=A0A0G1AUR8_UNCKA|nr:MAG: hypothetical protein UU92_C0007G0052 [candidate division WWE3 bacterium GW2011_GWA1_42_12]KKS34729.1 MAG: hypothetical protein UU97_C0007G0019 [candidate division WWE3 bacterium GW2011_GWD1_42_14]KKS37836.1 MAG: hypothetical protein UV00_C0011G0019 [candidate division WWE3 bacterium GW2011_GWF1_42_14]KKS40202.1 MAG: hypothetical protein UV03_C0010G0019 [candidate division WWE3 bacterium GW2011_GWE1_42_16]KKS66189.1 MAG: hypothetical protein UV35_C0023G0017 [candidate division WWE3 bacte
MENIVNNPAPVQEKGDGGGPSYLIGVLILVIFVGVLLYFAIPAIKNAGPLEVNVPAPEVEVVIPENVNVETTPTEPTTPTE